MKSKITRFEVKLKKTKNGDLRVEDIYVEVCGDNNELLISSKLDYVLEQINIGRLEVDQLNTKRNSLMLRII